MDLDKIGSVMGAVKMISGKPEKSKNNGWGIIIVGIILAILGLVLVIMPESMVKIDGDRIVIFIPLILGVVLTIAGVASVIANKKRQQMVSDIKNSGVRYQGYIVGVRRTGFSTSDNYNNMVEQNDVIIEVQTPQGVKQTKVRLSGVGEHSFIKYNQNPTPITVYGDSSNPDNLIADENEVIAVANSVVEGIGEALKQ